MKDERNAPYVTILNPRGATLETGEVVGFAGSASTDVELLAALCKDSRGRIAQTTRPLQIIRTDRRGGRLPKTYFVGVFKGRMAEGPCTITVLSKHSGGELLQDSKMYEVGKDRKIVANSHTNGADITAERDELFITGTLDTQELNSNSVILNCTSGGANIDPIDTYSDATGDQYFAAMFISIAKGTYTFYAEEQGPSPGSTTITGLHQDKT